jgi:hypothetical protein
MGGFLLGRYAATVVAKLGQIPRVITAKKAAFEIRIVMSPPQKSLPPSRLG